MPGSAGPASSPSVGQALRERRGHHGWILADVAERTGISKSTLSKIENDLISPSYQSILQLCAGLGIENRRSNVRGPAETRGKLRGR